MYKSDEEWFQIIQVAFNKPIKSFQSGAEVHLLEAEAISNRQLINEIPQLKIKCRELTIGKEIDPTFLHSYCSALAKGALAKWKERFLF